MGFFLLQGFITNAEFHQLLAGVAAGLQIAKHTHSKLAVIVSERGFPAGCNIRVVVGFTRALRKLALYIDVKI